MLLLLLLILLIFVYLPALPNRSYFPRQLRGGTPSIAYKPNISKNSMDQTKRPSSQKVGQHQINIDNGIGLPEKARLSVAVAML